MPVTRALRLLRLLRLRRGMGRDEILAELGCDRSSFFRLLCDLRQQLEVSVELDTATGRYRVTDWGVLDSTHDYFRRKD